jgi:hypothetical protein
MREEGTLVLTEARELLAIILAPAGGDGFGWLGNGRIRRNQDTVGSLDMHHPDLLPNIL